MCRTMCQWGIWSKQKQLAFFQECSNLCSSFLWYCWPLENPGANHMDLFFYSPRSTSGFGRWRTKPSWLVCFVETNHSLRPDCRMESCTLVSKAAPGSCRAYEAVAGGNQVSNNSWITSVTSMSDLSVSAVWVWVQCECVWVQCECVCECSVSVCASVRECVCQYVHAPANFFWVKWDYDVCFKHNCTWYLHLTWTSMVHEEAELSIWFWRQHLYAPILIGWDNFAFKGLLVLVTEQVGTYSFCGPNSLVSHGENSRLHQFPRQMTCKVYPFLCISLAQQTENFVPNKRGHGIFTWPGH